MAWAGKVTDRERLEAAISAIDEAFHHLLGIESEQIDGETSSVRVWLSMSRAELAALASEQRRSA